MTAYKFHERQSEKPTGPSLQQEGPSEAGEACDNTRWNSHYARSCDGRRHHPQSAHEAKVHEEGREGTWWHAWCVHGHGASNGGNWSKEACAGTPAHIPNAMHKVPCSVLYMMKYILYTYMPSAVLRRPESSCYHSGEVCIRCANQSVVSSFACTKGVPNYTVYQRE